MAMHDIRRQDERYMHLDHTYVTKSAVIDINSLAKETVLFSFPLSWRGTCWIHSICMEITTAFNGTPTLLIGEGTIPLDSTTTGGVVTVVDADEYLNTTSAAPTALGFKSPGNAEDFIALAGQGGKIVVAADSAVPVIYATLTAAGTLTTGSARIYICISKIR